MIDSRFIHSLLLLITFPLVIVSSSQAQSWKLTPENIQRALDESEAKISKDSLRPGFHLTPPAGCMGDPNGGIYHNGLYHIFYGLNPFRSTPGSWYWAHATSPDLLHWNHSMPTLTPAFDLGLTYIGSGSTIVTRKGKALAFYSASEEGPMEFWQAQLDDDLSNWQHELTKPVLTLDEPGIPAFDDFWRDPFVFETGGRTFLIACADLLEENVVTVPIFEATNDDLTSWDYRGTLFTYPKHKLRNLEVPEFRKLGDKWLFMASCDAPTDRTIYFAGDFDLNTLSFQPDQEGILDYSGHYYAQETIQDDMGNLFLMAWIPGWDREWLPNYMNEPLKNSSDLWNGCFALPRQLSWDANDRLVQLPISRLKELRQEAFSVASRELPVQGPTTAYDVLEEVQGNQMELNVTLDLGAASFCGLNLLCDEQGEGGLFIIWSGNLINIDGVKVELPDWEAGQHLNLQIFVDKQFIEVFIKGGLYTVSRKVAIEHIQGDYVSLSRLGGTARLVSLQGWYMGDL